MRLIVDFAPDEFSFSRAEILQSQGIPDKASLSGNFERVYKKATESYHNLADPKGVIAGITAGHFEEVFRGEGLNERKNPVEEIFRKSDYLALFAVTLGYDLSEKVTELFSNGEYADGYMLDSVSSYAADKLADLAAVHLQSELSRKEASLRVLCYSPGYCGWHISGQRKLFEALHPEEIGITLNESCLMNPIKSVSGVLIAGHAEIHKFENSYPFCNACTARSCIRRMRDLNILNAQEGKYGTT